MNWFVTSFSILSQSPAGIFDLMAHCLFIGSKKFGLDCLALLSASFPSTVCAAVTVDDRNDTRTVYTGFVRLAKQNALTLHTLPRGGDLRPYLETYKPALVFVCNWYRLIAPELLAMPKRGFAGIHFSLLPQYRGGAPVAWAMINGEQSTGFSLFRIEEGMDFGPLYAQGRVAIGEDDYIADVLARLENDSLRCLEAKFPAIVDGSAVPVPQAREKASYAAQRLPEDGEIDWRRSQRRIYDFIRAQSRPYPGAYTPLEGKRLHIWRARPREGIYYGHPGQVAAFDRDEAIVVCGDDKALILQETSLDGVPCTPKQALKSISRRLERESMRPCN